MNLDTSPMDICCTLIAAAAVAVWPGAAGLLQLPLLGIPLVGLASALLGSGFSHLTGRRRATDEVATPLLGIISDAFLGGWIAVVLYNVPQVEGYGFKAIPIEVVAGLAAYLMRVTRQKAGGYFERAFQAGLNVWAGVFNRGKRNGDHVP